MSGLRAESRHPGETGIQRVSLPRRIWKTVACELLKGLLTPVRIRDICPFKSSDSKVRAVLEIVRQRGGEVDCLGPRPPPIRRPEKGLLV